MLAILKNLSIQKKTIRKSKLIFMYYLMTVTLGDTIHEKHIDIFDITILNRNCIHLENGTILKKKKKMDQIITFNGTRD